MLGQRAKYPVDGLSKQSFEPPPQLGAPELPMRLAPIIRTTVPVHPRNIREFLSETIAEFERKWREQPVTIGGNIRCRVRGGTNDMKISRREAMSDVPMKKFDR